MLSLIKIIIISLIFLAGLHFYLNNNPETCLYKVKQDGIIEGMTSNMDTTLNKNCPDMLIQHGLKYYLYNSKLAKVPGVNPVEFNNLEEYVEFTEWQRHEGIRCPILYLQHSYNTQGESVYKIRPSVKEVCGGLPPNVITPYANRLYNPNISEQKPVPVNESTNMSANYTTPSQTLPTDSMKNFTMLVDAGHDDLPYNYNSLPGNDPSSYYVGKTTPLDIMDQKEESLLHSPNAMDPNWGGSDYTQKLVDQGYYADNEVSIQIA